LSLGQKSDANDLEYHCIQP